MLVSISPQSSKCRTVLSSPQKIDGFKRLDCQSAMFNDYNFVFTSFAKKQQQQQSWLRKMKKKKRKKRRHTGGGGCFLDVDPGGRANRDHHLVVAESPRCNDSVIILKCMHYYIKELDNLHECSLLCLGVLCHSCCGTEVHVEKNFDCMNLYDTCENDSIWFMHSVIFLQASSKIPHRQGFRPH